jgi:anti-sigma regulatory factor (Ser/Thr protein kinase)
LRQLDQLVLLERVSAGQKVWIEVVYTLPPELSSVGIARALVSQLSSPAGLLEMVQVVVAEFASNAVRHAGTPFTVVLNEEGETVTVSVSDGVSTQPKVQHPPPTIPNGRGLMVVEGLSEDWGVNQHPGDGKTVWARIAVT